VLGQSVAPDVPSAALTAAKAAAKAAPKATPEASLEMNVAIVPLPSNAAWWRLP
jgi:hypothetical protein